MFDTTHSHRGVARRYDHRLARETGVEVLNRGTVLNPKIREESVNPYEYFPTPQSKYQAQQNVNHFNYKAVTAAKELDKAIDGERNAKEDRERLMLRRAQVRLRNEVTTAETWKRHWCLQVTKL